MTLLSGLRVLELSDGPSAAFAGKWLARWGADVVPLRDNATAFKDPHPAVSRDALLEHLDGGKQPAHYLSGEPRLAAIDALAVGADVILVDASPADFEALRVRLEGAGDRRCVIVSITPFGLDGPYRDFEATSATLLALGGYSFIMGDPGRAPLAMPGLYPYYQTGLLAYIAALATYVSMDSGRKTIELSVLESLVSLHQHTTVQWTYTGRIRGRAGNWAAGNPLNSILPCKDGWLALCVVAAFWEPFVWMLEKPELLEDPRFLTQADRTANAAELAAIIAETIKNRTNAELMETGQHTFRVPLGTVATTDEVIVDPQLESRGFWHEVRLSSERPIVKGGASFHFYDEPAPREVASSERHSPAELPSWRAAETAPPSSLGSAHLGADSAAPVGPLNGVRVIDLTRVWAGPLAGRILADLGAEVIKLEAPNGRGAGGLALGGSGERPWNQQGSFNKLNRNKRSLVLDLKAEEGRQLFIELVRRSDVVLENFVIERWSDWA